jgi:hypothetical protein
VKDSTPGPVSNTMGRAVGDLERFSAETSIFDTDNEPIPFLVSRIA